MKNNLTKLKIGITTGDTNGIGPEIIIKTLERKGILSFFIPIVFGSTKLFSYYKNTLNSLINFHGIDSINKAMDNKVNVLNIWKDAIEIEMGKPTPASGKYAFESLQAATEALKKGEIDVLVTAPIDKNNIQSENFNFHGHTEYLEDAFGEKSLMFMIHDTIKVGLVTNHLAVKDIAQYITQEQIVAKAQMIHKSLIEDFQINKPKIAILGLNPHNGDNGLLGKEEIEIINPAIKTLHKKKILAFGPFAADGFFGSGDYTAYDAVLAMYHDQGLVAFKNISFGAGVNFTANLSAIRTSPDHGTAFDIVGKDKADESSFNEAIFKGIELYKNRKLYKDLTRNSLQKQEVSLNYQQFSSQPVEVKLTAAEIKALENE